MGLPIWRDPEEVKVKKEKEQLKSDPTAAARSPIRRRPQYARRSLPPRREQSRLPPRFEREPPPSVGFNGLREPRRGEQRGVPPVSTLLESAERRDARTHGLPPPAPDATNYSMDALHERGRQLHDSITELQGHADRLEAEARAIRAGMSPSDWRNMEESERTAWLESNLATNPISPASPPVRWRRQRGSENNASSEYGLPRQESPESLFLTTRPRSRNEIGARRSALPTPPHDASETADSPFPPEPFSMSLRRANGTSHPLSRSWRPDSPIDGLGDRARSPSSTDGWEIMRTTIAPDTTLPSADSSFASTAASQSFNSNETGITEPDRNSSGNSRRDSQQQQENQSDSASSVDPEDLVCNEEENQITAALAEGMYFRDSSCTEGRERIARHHEAFSSEGNRFASYDEPERVEIGFRLIEEALDSPQGRERVSQLTRTVDGRGFDGDGTLEDWIFATRRDRNGRQTRGAQITDDEPPSPHPERYSANTHATVRHASEQVHDYFRRFTADSLLSPPPRYEPLASHPDVTTFTSRDGGEADALLLSGDEQDLRAMRRVVDRFAQRDDVPDDMWMSVGLNLSRTRASPSARDSTSTRVRTAGRGANSRL